jgi:hypothetical protein
MDTVLSSSIKLTFFLTQKIYIFLFIQLLKRQKKKGCALYINISVYSKQPCTVILNVASQKKKKNK